MANVADTSIGTFTAPGATGALLPITGDPPMIPVLAPLRRRTIIIANGQASDIFVQILRPGCVVARAYELAESRYFPGAAEIEREIRFDGAAAGEMAGLNGLIHFRARISRDGYWVLDPRIMYALRQDGEPPREAFLVVKRDRLELWSTAYFDAVLERRQDQIDILGDHLDGAVDEQDDLDAATPPMEDRS